MKPLKKNVFYGLAGACGSMAGFLPAVGCAGSCIGCFGCLAPGAAVVVLTLVNRQRRRTREKTVRKEDAPCLLPSD